MPHTASGVSAARSVSLTRNSSLGDAQLTRGHSQLRGAGFQKKVCFLPGSKLLTTVLPRRSRQREESRYFQTVLVFIVFRVYIIKSVSSNVLVLVVSSFGIKIFERSNISVKHNFLAKHVFRVSRSIYCAVRNYREVWFLNNHLKLLKVIMALEAAGMRKVCSHLA